MPIAILVAWQFWTVQSEDPNFPRLSTILVEFKDLWLFSEFGTHVVPSLKRILLGFGIATVVGVGLGIPLGLSRWTRAFAMPHVEYWRAMPPPALLPISIILLHSIGDVQKVTLIAFFCLFPILLNTMDGVRGDRPDDDRHRTLLQRPAAGADPPARRAGGTPADRRRHAHQPVARGDHHGRAEYFSSTSGVGYVLLISKNTFEFAPMWAAILLIGLLGYGLNVLFMLAERRILAWHRGWRAATPL